MEKTPKEPQWIAAAREFGGELASNGYERRMPNRDDKGDIAEYHPMKNWQDMPEEDRQAAIRAWNEGYNSAKSLLS